MFIQTEVTPNPKTIKFILDIEVIKNDTLSITRKDKNISPLANSLFQIEEIDSIFLSNDFISVTKTEQSNWDILKPEILTIISDHFVANKPVVNEVLKHKNTENSNPIIREIIELIDTRIRPAVAEDGGDIIFHEYKNGIVYLEMHGACAGCPSSTITLKEGVENLLKHYVPEIKSVECIN